MVPVSEVMVIRSETPSSAATVAMPCGTPTPRLTLNEGASSMAARRAMISRSFRAILGTLPKGSFEAPEKAGL